MSKKRARMRFLRPTFLVAMTWRKRKAEAAVRSVGLDQTKTSTMWKTRSMGSKSVSDGFWASSR